MVDDINADSRSNKYTTRRPNLTLNMFSCGFSSRRRQSGMIQGLLKFGTSQADTINIIFARTGHVIFSR